MKPILYIVTPVWRDDNLGKVAKSIRPLCELFQVRWLAIFEGRTPFKNESVWADVTDKRNIALSMITEPGWIYYLDDDNLIHPSFGPSLANAIQGAAKVLLFKTIRSDGSVYLHGGVIEACKVDTASYAVHTDAAKGISWKPDPLGDYYWIKDVVAQGFPPTFVNDGLTFYNGLR